MPVNKHTNQISRERLWMSSKSQSNCRKEQSKPHKAPLRWILLVLFFPVAANNEKTEEEHLTTDIYKFAVEINREYWWRDCSWPNWRCCSFMVCIILHHHDITAVVLAHVRCGKNITTAVFEDLISIP